MTQERLDKAALYSKELGKKASLSGLVTAPGEDREFMQIVKDLFVEGYTWAQVSLLFDQWFKGLKA